MGCHFLYLLVPEIDCNCLFKEITKGNDILEEKRHDLEDFQVSRYPKIVTASYINFISASENAL